MDFLVVSIRAGDEYTPGDVDPDETNFLVDDKTLPLAGAGLPFPPWELL